jgi:hypothetical protein
MIKILQLSDQDRSADRRLICKIGSALTIGINYSTDRLPGYLLRLKGSSQKWPLHGRLPVDLLRRLDDLRKTQAAVREEVYLKNLKNQGKVILY